MHAGADANKAGTWGYGPVVGGGIECLIWDRMWLGADVQGLLMFLQSHKATVNGVPNTEIIKGGFKPMVTVMGTVGYHF